MTHESQKAAAMKWRKGGFEKFREAWIRQFCADRKLSTAAKTVLTNPNDIKPAADPTLFIRGWLQRV